MVFSSQSLERAVKEKVVDLVPILVQNPGLAQNPDLEGKDHTQNTGRYAFCFRLRSYWDFLQGAGY